MTDWVNENAASAAGVGGRGGHGNVGEGVGSTRRGSVAAGRREEGGRKLRIKRPSHKKKQMVNEVGRGERSARCPVESCGSHSVNVV